MRPFIFDPANDFGSVRLCTQISADQIPLAHLRPPTLSPDLCVSVEQSGRPEAAISLIDVYAVDGAGMVGPSDGIDSMLPVVTPVFLNGEPCFYRHRLQYPVRLPDGALLWRPAAPVTVTGASIRMTAVPGPSPGLYWIDLHMTNPFAGAFAVYDAVDGAVDRPGLREVLLAEPGLRISDLATVAGAAMTDPVGSIDPVTPTRTRMQTSLRHIADVRDRLTVTWRVEVMDGYDIVSSSPNQSASLIAMEQATVADGMSDGWLTVSANPLSLSGITRSGNQYLRIVTGNPEVEADCHPHGTGPVRLRWRSGHAPVDLPDQFDLVGGSFVPRVAVSATDASLPFVSISGRTLDDPWHIRVRLGRTTKTIASSTYLYALPEYNSDLFSPIPPYSRQEELPIRIDECRFRVRRTPIDATVAVTAMIRTETPVVLTVVEVDQESGLIRLREAVPDGAPLVISYAVRKDFVSYRGGDHYLDFNPRHPSYVPTGHTYRLGDGRLLAGRPVYLYWLPYAKLQGAVETPLRQQTLTHSFKPLTDPTAILLATLQLDIKFGPSSLRILDARRRGGGLADHVQYAAGMADISSFDGEPTALAGAYVIDIAPWAPIDDLGQVREIAQRRGPFGQLPLVNLIDWPQSILLGPEALWGDTVEVS